MKLFSFTSRILVPALLGTSLGTSYIAAAVDVDPMSSRLPSVPISSTPADSVAGVSTSSEREESDDLRRLEDKRTLQPLGAVNEAAVDPILGPQVSGILKSLQKVYPFNPQTDLGDDLFRHLKGTREWDDYLTETVSKDIENVKAGDREAITSLGAAFKFGQLPFYTYELTLSFWLKELSGIQRQQFIL